jgi:hypothetical protein
MQGNKVPSQRKRILLFVTHVFSDGGSEKHPQERVRIAHASQSRASKEFDTKAKLSDIQYPIVMKGA